MHLWARRSFPVLLWTQTCTFSISRLTSTDKILKSKWCGWQSIEEVATWNIPHSVSSRMIGALLPSHLFQPSSSLPHRSLNEISNVLELECSSRVFQCATLFTQKYRRSLLPHSHSLLQSWNLPITIFYLNSQLYCRFVLFKFRSIYWSFVSSIACLLWQPDSPLQIHLFMKFQSGAKPTTRSTLGRPNWENCPIPWKISLLRSMSLAPFGRLHRCNLTLFRKEQLNTPNLTLDQYQPGENEFANQSAYGIPDNAFVISKAAIHPYFLAYADLSRSFHQHTESFFVGYCMQDICITDSNDPSYCATPADIKVVQSKVSITQGLTAEPIQTYPELLGDQLPPKSWWFFVKCWADLCTFFSFLALPNQKILLALGLPSQERTNFPMFYRTQGLAQPVYQDPKANNWFMTPHLSKLHWSQATAQKKRVSSFRWISTFIFFYLL